MIDRFLVNEPGNDILEDEEKPILVYELFSEGKETSYFLYN